MSGFDWSKITDDELRQLAATYSASQIGGIIGASRNAVIGRVHRRKIALCRGKTQSEIDAIREKRQEAARRREEKLATKVLAKAEAKAAAPEFDANERQKLADHPQFGRGVAFIDAREGQCRWPLWQNGTPLASKRFCGEPVLPKQSYCAHCYRLSYSAKFTADIDRMLRLPKLARAA